MHIFYYWKNKCIYLALWTTYSTRCLFAFSKATSNGNKSVPSDLCDARDENEATDNKRYTDMFIYPDSKWSKTVFPSSGDLDLEAASTGVVDVC